MRLLGQKTKIERKAENDECVDDREPQPLFVEFFQVFILHGTHPFSILFIIISFQNIGKIFNRNILSHFHIR